MAYLFAIYVIIFWLTSINPICAKSFSWLYLHKLDNLKRKLSFW